MIYYLLFLLPAAFAILDFSGKKTRKHQNFIFWIVGLLFFFTSSIRFKCGTDWDAYELFFETPLNHYFEPGFRLLAFLAKTVIDDYQFLLLLSSLFIIPLFFSIKKLSPTPLVSSLAFFCYLFLIFLGGMRQAVAISLVAFSVIFIIRKNVFWFLLFVFAATTMHSFAIIFFPAYFLVNKKYSSRSLFILVLACFILGQLELKQAWIYLFKNFKLNSLVDHYLHVSSINEDLNYGVRNGILLLERWGIVFFLLQYRKIFERRVKKFNIFLNLSIITTVIFFLFVNSIRNFAGRGSLYFKFGEVILAGVMVFVPTTARGKLLVLFSLLLFFFVRILLVYIFSNPYYYPFQSIFDSM
jgi:hypothetical protein